MSNILNGITEAKRSPEPDYNDPSWDEKVSNVGQKAKQAEVLKSKGKEPKTRWNPETKKYYVDFSDDDVKKESVGIPYPGTYEQTNDMFKSSGQKRIGTLTTEQGVTEGSGGNWYIRVNGKILNDTKFKPVIFSSEGEARSHAMKLADKKRIPLSQMKLTKSWMDAPEQGVAEEKQRLDPHCWTDKHKEGTKMKGGVRVNNCVPNESAIMKGIKV